MCLPVHTPAIEGEVIFIKSSYFNLRRDIGACRYIYENQLKTSSVFDLVLNTQQHTPPLCYTARRKASPANWRACPVNMGAKTTSGTRVGLYYNSTPSFRLRFRSDSKRHPDPCIFDLIKATAFSRFLYCCLYAQITTALRVAVAICCGRP